MYLHLVHVNSPITLKYYKEKLFSLVCYKHDQCQRLIFWCGSPNSNKQEEEGYWWWEEGGYGDKETAGGRNGRGVEGVAEHSVHCSLKRRSILIFGKLVGDALREKGVEDQTILGATSIL